MPAKKGSIGGSTKRFGVRYGRRTRARLLKIEKDQKKTHKCPFCNYVKVKRMSVGIWHCKKCDAKFTSKAYRVDKFPIVKTIPEEVQKW
ncbi:MAG: 50S ribosomal protein L37ae [Candidatus Woesearchaeota archaeon]